MKKLAEGGEDAGVIGRLGVELEGRSLLRDWDRNKVRSFHRHFLGHSSYKGQSHLFNPLEVSFLSVSASHQYASILFQRWIKRKRGKEKDLMSDGEEER